MSEKIKIDTGRLRSTESVVSGEIRKMRARAGDLADAAGALSGMWEGEAHAAFHEALMADILLLESQCRALGEIVSYEKNAVREYCSCEKKASSLAASVRI